MGLLKLLLEQFLRRQIHLLASEVFNSEPDSTKLNRIELLDLVVKLAFWVLKGSDN